MIVMEAARIDIAVVSVPVYSHLQAIVQFSKRLVELHPHIQVTCLIPALGPPSRGTKALIQTLPPTIDHVFLPLNMDDQPQGSHPGDLVRAAISRSLPCIFDALNALQTTSTSKLVALIADGLISQALEIGKKLNLLSYIFFPSTAMLLSLCLYSSELDEIISSEYRDLVEPIQIPGCIPVRGTDLPEPCQDRTSEFYKEFLMGNKRYFLADGVLLNSFVEMEAETIATLLQQESRGYPPVYPVGPITQNGPSSGANGLEHCLKWLDQQPPNSVLYVSLGSGGTLFHDQLNELALGLELSGQRFLWVARPPSKFGIISDLDSANDDSLHYLPSGFLERTKGVGLVVPCWAPQVQVLGHKSTGGFLSHCGWNSILESVVHGVPLIAWPLFAEQKMNAALLTKGLGVALRPKVNQKGMVESQEVSEVVKSLIEGGEGAGIRQRMEDLKVAAADALKESGSSTRTLSQLALNWKSLRGT